MSYLLDTNTCIGYLTGRAPSVRVRLHRLPRPDIMVCSVVKAELFYGAARSHDPVRTLSEQQAFLSLFQSLPFDDTAALHYGQLRSHLAALGTPIGPNGLLIAAIALAHGSILVTRNLREFGRVPGLLLENWEDGA